MLKELIKQSVLFIGPRWVRELEERIWLSRQARLLHEQCGKCAGVKEMVDVVRANPFIIANQRNTEITALLELVRELRPRRLCEIGSAGGGTLFLFCRAAAPDAQVLSIDLGYTPNQQKVYPTFALPGQKITCLQADSHTPQTLEQARQWLGGAELDFLFIDGDHSYQGVKSDFDMFAPLVRQGGLVGFHDITPDFRTRFGTPTRSDVGEVPRYWQEVKAKYPDARELVEHPDQDGLGIGVLHWDGAR